MDQAVKRLAEALKLAEQAHALREKAGFKDEWPTFYAQWLLDNVHIWSAAIPTSCDDGGCVIGEWNDDR